MITPSQARYRAEQALDTIRAEQELKATVNKETKKLEENFDIDLTPYLDEVGALIRVAADKGEKTAFYRPNIATDDFTRLCEELTSLGWEIMVMGAPAPLKPGVVIKF